MLNPFTTTTIFYQKDNNKLIHTVFTIQLHQQILNNRSLFCLQHENGFDWCNMRFACSRRDFQRFVILGAAGKYNVNKSVEKLQKKYKSEESYVKQFFRCSKSRFVFFIFFEKRTPTVAVQLCKN